MDTKKAPLMQLIIASLGAKAAPRFSTQPIEVNNITKQENRYIYSHVYSCAIL